MERLAFSSGGWLQRVLIAIRVEAVVSGRACNKQRNSYPDKTPPRRPGLEVGIHRVVNWPPLHADPPTGGFHGLGLKHPVVVGDHLEKQQNGHSAGEDTAETTCAGSRDPLSSGLATTADPPTGGCHGLGLKLSVKAGDNL